MHTLRRPNRPREHAPQQMPVLDPPTKSEPRKPMTQVEYLKGLSDTEWKYLSTHVVANAAKYAVGVKQRAQKEFRRRGGL